MQRCSTYFIWALQVIWKHLVMWLATVFGCFTIEQKKLMDCISICDSLLKGNKKRLIFFNRTKMKNALFTTMSGKKNVLVGGGEEISYHYPLKKRDCIRTRWCFVWLERHFLWQAVPGKLNVELRKKYCSQLDWLKVTTNKKRSDLASRKGVVLN